LSCSGYFETLLRRVEEQGDFKKQALQEIQELKGRLERKLVSLRVKGDFHKANEVEAELDFLERTEKSIKKLVET